MQKQSIYTLYNTTLLSPNPPDFFFTESTILLSSNILHSNSTETKYKNIPKQSRFVLSTVNKPLFDKK